jgi:hypothetical protein
MADIADKFTRNEILSSNEVRGLIGFKPSTEPKADQLINSNMPVDMTGVGDSAADPNIVEGEVVTPELEAPDPELDSLENDLDGLLSELGT